MKETYHLVQIHNIPSLIGLILEVCKVKYQVKATTNIDNFLLF